MGNECLLSQSWDAAVMLMGEDGCLHSSAAAASQPRDAENGRLEGGNRDFAASLTCSPQ